MAWYNISKFIKIAGPKEKIQQFKITDPCLKMFVMKYEGMLKFIAKQEKNVKLMGYNIEKMEPNPETGVMEPSGEEIFKPVTNQNDVNEYIRTQILPTVYSKADPNSENNNYLKKIDIQKEYNAARDNNIFNHDLDRAYNLYQQDKEAGEKFYLDVINRIKKQGFDSWINYFINNQEHPEYEQSPAFVYLILSSIINSSGEKSKNPVATMTPPVIALMFKNIKNMEAKYQGPVDNEKISSEIASLYKKNTSVEDIAKKTGESVENIQTVIDYVDSKDTDICRSYNKQLTKHCEELAKLLANKGIESGWIKFPRKDKIVPRVNEEGKNLTVEEIFEENLETIEKYSIPNAWCTTRAWNGKIYLERGDFWILIDQGKAGAAIRFEGPNIEEIAGDQKRTNGESRTCPVEYWKEIIEIITKENLVDKIKGFLAVEHWKMLLQQKELNQSFFNEDGTPNIEEIEAFKVELLKNPSLYNRVTNNERFANYPQIIEELKVVCKQGWFAKIQKMEGFDAMSLAQNAQANAQEMPDFVLADPAFIEIIHGRLTVLYENNPERIRDVLDKVPNHWIIYPQGKEIFKRAIINKYTGGMYWKANAFGFSRKTKEQKNEILINEKLLEEVQQIIGQHLPELNEDEVFQAQIETIKQESCTEAMEAGYFSQEMPKQAVEQFFLNPEKIEQMSTDYANKISSKKIPSTKRDTTFVFSEQFMNKEISFIAPGWIKNLAGFKNLVEAIKKKVLLLNIKDFKLFDQQNKQNQELYSAYKQHVLQGDPLKKRLREGEDIVDESIKQDPEYRNAVEDLDANTNQVVLAINLKPQVFLTLPLNVQEKKEVFEAYLRKRVNTMVFPLYRELPFEFSKLPEFIKNRQDVRDKYVEVVAALLKSALPRDPRYIDCSKIEGFAMTDARIMQICQTRAMGNAPKQASVGWYKKLGFFI